ncbi:MAG: hypothetical protein ACFE9Z_00475 [Promethearchaeota archaeon]
MKSLKKIGNVLSLLFCLLLIIISFAVGYLMALIAPSALDSVTTPYIIPFGRVLEMAIFGLFFANIFMTIGIVGLKSERRLIVYGIGIVIIAIYSIIEILLFDQMFRSHLAIGGGGEGPIGLVSFIVTLVCIIGMLVGYLIIIIEARLDKRKK